MANDHYIPQCLTRPWHDTSHGKAALRFFDFATGGFHHRNARKLFARRGVNSRSTEMYLEKYIETPFALAQDKIIAAGADASKIEAAFAQLPHTALTGIYWLQGQRIRDAKRAQRKHRLDDFAKHGFSWLENVSALIFQEYEPRLYAAGNALFFPDTATFPIPLADQPPALALPIHTGLLLVFANRTTSRTLLDGWMRDQFMPTAFSIGLTPRRVLVPPEMKPLAKTFVETRGRVREMFRTISGMGRSSGLTTWGLTEAASHTGSAP